MIMFIIISIIIIDIIISIIITISTIIINSSMYVLLYIIIVVFNVDIKQRSRLKALLSRPAGPPRRVPPPGAWNSLFNLFNDCVFARGLQNVVFVYLDVEMTISVERTSLWLQLQWLQSAVKEEANR